MLSRLQRSLSPSGPRIFILPLLPHPRASASSLASSGRAELCAVHIPFRGLFLRFLPTAGFIFNQQLLRSWRLVNIPILWNFLRVVPSASMDSDLRGVQS